MNKSKYSIHQGYITQKIGKKVAIFSGEDMTLFTLNGTAKMIFQGIKLGRNEKEIVKELIANFEISESEAEKDVKKFLDLLVSKKILIKK